MKRSVLILGIVAAILIVGGAFAFIFMDNIADVADGDDSGNSHKIADKVDNATSSDSSSSDGDSDIVSEVVKFNYQNGDTEGVVNYPLSIANIKLSVLLTEKQDVIRLSFRSKGNFSVNDLAREHFNGGGHLNAAGGTLTCTLEEAVDKLKSVLSEYKELLKNEDW